jgi:hypothetical protein
MIDEILFWRKSKHSNPNGACVEVGTGKAAVGVRDTKQAHLGEARTTLRFAGSVWQEFTAKVKEQS